MMAFVVVVVKIAGPLSRRSAGRLQAEEAQDGGGAWRWVVVVVVVVMIRMMMRAVVVMVVVVVVVVVWTAGPLSLRSAGHLQDEEAQDGGGA